MNANETEITCPMHRYGDHLLKLSVLPLIIRGWCFKNEVATCGSREIALRSSAETALIQMVSRTTLNHIT
jgi:hypothetical protein